MPTLHVYGLIIGASLILGWELALQAIKKYSFSEIITEKMLAVVLIFGLVFSRIWHVITDWHLYSNSPSAVLYVWNGGLSIVGGLLGATLAIIGICIIQNSRKTKFTNSYTPFIFTDILVHGVPLSQALGRLGNYFNQELYGLPSNLPWAIFIDPQYRLIGYENYSHFHPLFLYEMVVTTTLGLLLWKKRWTIGSGSATMLYVSVYGVARFLLDFLRIERAEIEGLGLGINQVVLLVFVAGFFGLYLYFRKCSANNLVDIQRKKK